MIGRSNFKEIYKAVATTKELKDNTSTTDKLEFTPKKDSIPIKPVDETPSPQSTCICAKSVN